jgi:hypothetical protein
LARNDEARTSLGVAPVRDRRDGHPSWPAKPVRTSIDERGVRDVAEEAVMRIGSSLLGIIVGLFACTAVARGDVPASAWDPDRWREEDTVELRTTAPGEKPHWFKVWLVVLDGQLYVRLGGRAAGRFEGNTTRPEIGVRIAGLEFERVTGTSAPDMVGPVADAMADKYWSDVFVRFVSHPLTLRLAPASDQSAAGGAPSAQSTR